MLIGILSGCGKDASNQAETSSPEHKVVESSVANEATESFSGVNVRFDYQRAGTHASNQLAVWVEDMDGNLVKTIYVTNFTTYGGYSKREDALSHWAAISHISEMEGDRIDAVSGATPTTGKQEFFWDGTNQDGSKVPDGKYVVKLEGTLYWSSNVLFEGVIDTLNPEDEITVTATYSETDETNKNMIQNVQMTFAK